MVLMISMHDVFQYPGSIFRVPMISRWAVVVSGSQKVDDLKKAMDNQVSADEALREVRV